MGSRRSSEGSFFFPTADFEREAAIKMHTQLELREGGDEHPSESRGVLVSIFFSAFILLLSLEVAREMRVIGSQDGGRGRC